MKVLVACEFSGIVRDAFREMVHDAKPKPLERAQPNLPWNRQCDGIAMVTLSPMQPVSAGEHGGNGEVLGLGARR